DEFVKTSLRQYFLDNNCEKGECLANDLQSWGPLAILLEHDLEVGTGIRPSQNKRLIAALKAVMVDPALDDRQIAAIANTNQQKSARMSEVLVLRRLWKRQGS